jgi:hypothetical protein
VAGAGRWFCAAAGGAHCFSEGKNFSPADFKIDFMFTPFAAVAAVAGVRDLLLPSLDRCRC